MVKEKCEKQPDLIGIIVKFVKFATAAHLFTHIHTRTRIIRQEHTANVVFHSVPTFLSLFPVNSVAVVIVLFFSFTSSIQKTKYQLIFSRQTAI